MKTYKDSNQTLIENNEVAWITAPHKESYDLGNEINSDKTFFITESTIENEKSDRIYILPYRFIINSLNSINSNCLSSKS